MEQLNRSVDLNIMWCFDLKMLNVFFGIGACSSKYCCAFCNLSSDDFEFDLRTLRSGGNLRTLGMYIVCLKKICTHIFVIEYMTYFPWFDLGDIRRLSAQYQDALQKWNSLNRKTKLSSKDFFSCERNPIITWEADSSKVLELAAPAPLHTRLGLGKYVYSSVYFPSNTYFSIA